MSMMDTMTLKFRVLDPNEGVTRWVVWDIDSERGMIYYRATTKEGLPLAMRGTYNPYELTKTDTVLEHMARWFEQGASLLPGWGGGKVVMANTTATCIGRDKSRMKEDHRLGSESAEARAQTWRTTATAYVQKNGAGIVEVKRNGHVIHHFEFGPEE